MKRNRFFEKSYLITLALFLLFLNAGIFSLTVYTYKKSEDSAVKLCRWEMACVKEAFERDVALSGDDGGALLPISYVNFYVSDGMFLQFTDKKGESFGDLPANEKLPLPGSYRIVQQKDQKTVFITDTFADGEYTVTYAKDISYINDELTRLCVAFGGVSLLASLVLAVVLYFVQRRLFAPLEKLRAATNALSGGDFAVRADEKGKDEIAQMAKDFNKMSRHLHEQMEELKLTAKQKQTMLDNLGHEMRTPLTSIYGYAEHIFRNNPPEEKRLHAMLDIMSESKRLKRISEILLDDAFLRENGIEKEQVNAKELLEKICHIHSPVGKEKGVEVMCEGDCPALEGDETLLEVLLSNLTENAIRACKPSGKVVIRAEDADGIRTLSVQDNGIGMTEEQLSHITEPFYRTDKARSREQGGTGLGLALCQRIAQAHGAKLEFVSSPEKGTTAYVRFV